MILLAVIVVMSATDIEGASSPKTPELNRKISEISALQNRLSDRIAVALKTRDQLQNQIAELAKEINRIRDHRQIKSYHAAVKHPRINYNIELIRTLRVYIDRLNARLRYFRNGNETLTFLHQQVIDDLQLIQTLNDMEVDRLIHKINYVLDEYIPEIKNHLITVENIQGDSSEKIWDAIIKVTGKIPLDSL
jgi:chromosome segregation ATPase